MDCANCKLDQTCYRGESCYDQGYKQPEYEEADNRRMLTVASRLEAEYYMKLTRVEELSISAGRWVIPGSASHFASG